MKFRWLILNRDFSQPGVPAVQHDRRVGFLMQIDSHIDDVLFPQPPSFLSALPPSSAIVSPATSTDKRYVPIYALRPRPSQRENSLSAPITKGFAGYSLQRFSSEGVSYVSSGSWVLQVFSGYPAAIRVVCCKKNGVFYWIVTRAKLPGSA